MRCSGYVPCLFIFLLKNIRKLVLPIESFFACYGGVVNQRVAAFDVVVEFI